MVTRRLAIYPLGFIYSGCVHLLMSFITKWFQYEIMVDCFVQPFLRPEVQRRTLCVGISGEEVSGTYKVLRQCLGVCSKC